MNSDVELWFQSLSGEQKTLLDDFRQLILSASTEFNEELKWGQPCYSKQALVCYLQKAARHVTIGFQQGAHLNDPEQLLVGVGKDMRHIKVGLSDTIDKPAINRMIENAIEYDDSR